MASCIGFFRPPRVFASRGCNIDFPIERCREMSSGTPPEISLRFRNFWAGFNPDDFLVPLIEDAVGVPSRLIHDGGIADLEIVSIFNTKRRPLWQAAFERYRDSLPRALLDIPVRQSAAPSERARVSIWYTGENVRPPLGDWDAYWSFDPDGYCAGNHYFPLWWFMFPELVRSVDSAERSPFFLGRRVTLEEALSPRLSEGGGRPRFCCAFINNPEPMRLHAIEALKACGEVDIYGRMSGKVAPSKTTVAQNYQFVLCFESDVYPGYVTEKALEAWATGAVPIWRGSDPGGYLNPAALINAADMNGLEELCDTVADLQRNPERISRISAEPILTRPPDLTPIKNTLRRRVYIKNSGRGL